MRVHSLPIALAAIASGLLTVLLVEEAEEQGCPHEVRAVMPGSAVAPAASCRGPIFASPALAGAR